MKINRIPKALLISLLPISIAGCFEKDPSRLKSGEELYNYYCMECHRSKGLGENFEYLPKAKDPIEGYEVVLMIKYGYTQGHSMPMFEQLGDAQADAVAEYSVRLRAIHSPELE